MNEETLNGEVQRVLPVLPLLCVWECRRYNSNVGDSWAGALLIAAPDESTARKIFISEDVWHEEPKEVVQMEGVYADGPSRIIYDNDMR